MTAPSDIAAETGARRQSILLVNSGSRRGQECFDQAQEILREAGVNLLKATQYTDVDRLIADAKSAVRERVPLLIVGGGDGTINAVAGLLANTETAMAVLPLGTGNEFARDLHVPMTVEGACAVVTEGRIIHVDIGKILEKSFVNVVTAGLTTKIAEQLTDPMKKRFGRFAYAFAVVAGLRNLRPFQAELTTENGVTEFECMQIVVGNGRLHAGPFPVLPDANLRAGKFSIYALTGNRRSEFIKYALLLPGGHHASLDAVHSEYARTATLVTTPRVKVTVDGEIYCRTPVTVECRPGALKVMVPADYDL